MNALHSIMLSLPCLVALFWAIILFCNRKENTRPQNIWMVSLFIIYVCCLIWSILFVGVEDYSFYYKLDIIDGLLSLSIFPMIYLYFWSLTHDNKIGWKQYLCFLPSLFIGGISMALYLIMGEEQSTDFIRKVIESNENYVFESGSLQWWLFLMGWDIYYLVLLLQVVVIMTYSTLNLIRYRRGLEHYFSNLDEKSVKNHRVVLFGLYILLFLALFVFISRLLFYDIYFSVRYYFMLVVGITLYCMCYYVFKIRFNAGDIIQIEAENKDLPHSAEHNEVYAKLLPQFIKLIEEDRIFLNPNITLEDIARQVNSNRTYISRIINEKFDSNFYDFINKKRIEYAKTLIADNPMFTRDKIASESGFLHASNFSRVFKSQTGMTFSQWRKQID